MKNAKALKTVAWLSSVVALLMAIVSVLGIVDPTLYAKEAKAWIDQANAQDIFDLIIATPILFLSSYLLGRKSVKSLFVCLGILFYTAYTFILYTFFIHFNYAFLLYIAVLGLSLFTLIGGLISLDHSFLSKFSISTVKIKSISIFLFTIGMMFFLMWIKEIIPAILSHQIPKSVLDANFTVNPVHAIDLSFVLPGFIITSILLWKRKTLGYLFTGPYLVFNVLMGSSILYNFIYMASIDSLDPSSYGVVGVMGVIVLTSLFFAFQYFKEIPKS